MTRLLFLSSSTALLAACVVAPSPDDAGEPPEAFSTCSADEGWGLDLGGFDSASPPVSVDGDTLTVIVGHGGGCETHLYEICWPDGSFMESEPVQVELEIWHGGVEDWCEAYLTETLEFDLAPLQQAWKDSYGEGPGTIVIGLMGESVEYSFE